jgi:hypothetical protein
MPVAGSAATPAAGAAGPSDAVTQTASQTTTFPFGTPQQTARMDANLKTWQQRFDKGDVACQADQLVNDPVSLELLENNLEVALADEAEQGKLKGPDGKPLVFEDSLQGMRRLASVINYADHVSKAAEMGDERMRQLGLGPRDVAYADWVHQHYGTSKDHRDAYAAKGAAVEAYKAEHFEIGSPEQRAHMNANIEEWRNLSKNGWKPSNPPPFHGDAKQENAMRAPLQNAIMDGMHREIIFRHDEPGVDPWMNSPDIARQMADAVAYADYVDRVEKTGKYPGMGTITDDDRALAYEVHHKYGTGDQIIQAYEERKDTPYHHETLTSADDQERVARTPEQKREHDLQILEADDLVDKKTTPTQAPSQVKPHHASGLGL